jgi:hypothetical protein
MQARLSRRSILAASALLAPACRAWARHVASDAGSPSLVIAGPPASEAADWGRSLVPALSARPMPMRYWGGQDGVTGLNQFEARVFPGGQDALVFPGSALMAWLVGDPRVAFDASRLLPLLARVSPGVLMLRGALHARRGPVRVAMPPWSEQSLAGFLGLDLLRVAAEPVPAPAMEAAVQHAVDAVFLHGADVPARSRALSEAGLAPVFAVGCLTAQGMPCRDPEFAGVPTLPELLAAAPVPALWPAVAAASVLDLALALPALSTGASVALWRHAAAAAAGQDRSEARGLRLLSDSQAAASVAAVQMDASSQIALRRWVATKLRA